MPFVPSFKTHTSNTSSIMLSFFLCTSGSVDDDEPFSPSYVPYSMRMPTTHQAQISRSPESSRKKSKTRSKKNSKMIIGSPTDFRHDAHLGSDIKTDLSYSFWDSDRWRQELMKKNLYIPTLVEHSTTDDTSELLPLPSKPKSNKRNSITPQKRKPVPSLSDLLPPTTILAEPHEVPLPPSPTDSSQTFEDARSQTVSSSDAGTFSEFSVPSLVGHSSRGPSMDGDFVSTPERTSEEQEPEQEQKQVNYSPSLDTHMNT